MSDSPIKQNRIVSLADLVPHPRNYRVHPQMQIDKLVLSLQRFGQGRSIVVQDSPEHPIIVAGHGIVEAARALKWQELRADILPADWTDTQIEGYLIADNLHSEDASDNDELLAMLLQEQQDAGFDLRTIGTDDETLRQMLEAMGDGYLAGGEDGAGGDDYDTDTEDIEIRCKRGELWQLGKHRLLVDDCTKAENVQKLMQGEKADMVWTDPPYGVDYVGGTKDALTIANDDLDPVNLYRFLCDAFKSFDVFMRAGAVYYIAHPDIFTYEFIGAIRYAGWREARPPAIQWVKDSLVLGRGDYHSRSEPILYGWKLGAAHHAVQDRTQDNVWEIDRPKRSEDHPTMKPVELVERAIKNSSKPNDLVYDGFLGSGTTLIASHRLGRRCYGCEIDPKYATVILNRYEAETGQTATLLDAQEAVSHAG